MIFPSITSGPPVFTREPEIGHLHIYRDQMYFLLETKQDGKHYLLVWESRCCDCGDVFTVTCPVKGSGGFSRRCKAHRCIGKKVIQRNVHKAALGYHDNYAEKPEAMAAGTKAKKTMGVFRIPKVGSIGRSGAVVTEKTRQLAIANCKNKGIEYIDENDTIAEMF